MAVQLEVHFVHFEVVDGKADSSKPLVLAAFLVSRSIIREKS
jgi:hypothetical protein